MTTYQSKEEFYSMQKDLAPLEEPYVDLDFPADETSFGYEDLEGMNYNGFMRLSELCDDPQIICDGIDVNDIAQGSFGNCWILSSLAAVARYPHIIAHLFVKANVEMGQYTLRLFWRNEWRYVTIDDYVPVSSDGSLLGVRSKNPNELWPTIVEKAIAKIFGSYYKTDGGDGTLGIQIFTGCLPQFEYLKNHVSCTQEECDCEEEAKKKKKLKNTKKRKKVNTKETAEEEEEGVEEEPFGGLCKEDIWKSILKGVKNGNAIGFASENESGLGDTNTTESGIVDGHYYALIDACDYNGNQLVRLRNPWGCTEWKGAWSDTSKEMTTKVKRELNLRVTRQSKLIEELCKDTVLLPVVDTATDAKSRRKRNKAEKDDGVFWMHFDDVINCFSRMTVGHIVDIECFYKDENSFGYQFSPKLLHNVHQSSYFPTYRQILKHDEKDETCENEEGECILTQQFTLSVDRTCDVLIALRMIHDDMDKFNSYLELSCEELEIKCDGLYVFTGTRRRVPKGDYTFYVKSECRDEEFSDVEVTLVWENRKAQLTLNEEEVVAEEEETYEEEEE
ncbi:calcium-dependent cytoplasmic cysteine proteinase [Naegleria gruberi]|uniref:Calcium-dependent cytoplasmic cysteine proteinase n=1 Tax=Naegleria gruberi TaxID=5762 RepID=D2VKN2_NAEGR|nr:calcium-dependent cytoplasmic cysteine proteinase [Naegleria gruberi]EFC42719.1 calcium-dependent cytoplasmic cysteine proteinase [Naegleria gruberi]|eukprot:XP_002675463.1 calcium-dependent cytoplasmic cysteine proteinase [Naegleria gruberi strain NEG-M]